VGLLAAWPAAAVARGGLAVVLPRQRWEMQGTKRTHAVLTVAAAAALGDRFGDELGRPAAVNALHFLAESPPTRRRVAAGSGELRACLRAGDIGGAEAALAGAADEGIAWFEQAWRSVEGWGHRGITAATLWHLEGLRAPSRADRRAALVRQWLPWVDDPGQGAVGRLADERGLPDVLLAAGGEVGDAAVEALAEACLTGDGAPVLAGALAAGVGADAAVAALVIAACRLVLEQPGLQQLHTLTAAHALSRAVPGTNLRDGIVGVLSLVEEGWQSKVRVGRMDPEWGRGALSERPAAAGDVADVVTRLCRLEATPAFGHGIKAARACTDLMEWLPPALAVWPRAVLLGTAGSWPGMQRRWLMVRRRLGAD